jgi:hypothetical protein
LILVFLIELPQFSLSPPILGVRTVVCIGISCGLATKSYATGNAVIQGASALTFNIVGHFKCIFLMVLGYTVFSEGKAISALEICGLVISVAGMICYSLENMRSSFSFAFPSVICSRYKYCSILASCFSYV